MMRELIMRGPIMSSETSDDEVSSDGRDPTYVALFTGAVCSSCALSAYVRFATTKVYTKMLPAKPAMASVPAPTVLISPSPSPL